MDPRFESFLAVLLLLGAIACTAGAKPPNIVFLVMDDLGWNDIGFRNKDIHSPNLDKLAKEGVILNQSYVQPLCSPSRAAFMSGYYPYRLGLQHMVIVPDQAVCVPRNLTLLPGHLKNLGYATHMVGKWHLGFCNWNCTPTFRGFDSFLGYYNAEEDYYHRTVPMTKGDYYDFRDNKTLSVTQNGTYSTFVFQERVRNLIADHNTNAPLFLYLPLQSVHMPMEVPLEYYNMFPHIHDDYRRKFTAMVAAMDDVIGNLTSYLTQRGMYDDTIFFVTSDNGGWIQFGGNNYPLRGGKFTIWEGGTRGTAFLTGPGLEKVKGTVYNGMMHAVDWMPTIVSAAGGDVGDKDMDGMSLWEAIKSGSASPRSEFVYNIDDSIFPAEGHAGIRQGDYKLLLGFPGPYSGWYPPANQTWSQSAGLRTMDEIDKLTDPERVRAIKPFTLENPLGWDNKPRLYNLKDDPTERNDLAEKMPSLVARLKARLQEHRKKYVPPNWPLPDPASDPRKYGGAWTPGWC